SLRTVETVIVDEVHALAPTKRGAHLALSLERLSALTEREPQRIGLSATARPLEAVARFLGGDRPVDIVDQSHPPALDLRVMVPVPDMTHPERERAAPKSEEDDLDPIFGPEAAAPLDSRAVRSAAPLDSRAVRSAAPLDSPAV